MGWGAPGQQGLNNPQDLMGDFAYQIGNSIDGSAPWVQMISDYLILRRKKSDIPVTSSSSSLLLRTCPVAGVDMMSGGGGGGGVLKKASCSLISSMPC